MCIVYNMENGWRIEVSFDDSQKQVVAGCQKQRSADKDYRC